MKILPFDQGATFMQTQTSTAGRVFVSYSRKDSGFAQVLTDALLARGFEAYLDVKDIAPGEPWQERLAQLIRSADTVVFLVSPDSVKSDICEWETTEAKSLEKRILPVVHRRVEDGQIPETLSRLNFIFMDDAAAFGPQLDVLVSALQTDLAWVREHTRLAELARSWDAQGKRNTDLLRGPSIEKAEAWIASRPADAPMPTDIHRAFIAGSRQGATRRQRNGVAGAFAVAAIAGSLGIWAEFNRREAVTQRSLAVTNAQIADEQRQIAEARQADAERNLAAATSALNVIAIDVIADLRTSQSIPTSVQRGLIERIRSSIDAMSEKDLNNPTLLRLRGTIYSLAADTVAEAGGNQRASELFGDAIKFLERSNVLKSDEQTAIALGTSYSNRSKVSLRLGLSRQAISDARTSLNLLRTVCETRCESAQYSQIMVDRLLTLANAESAIDPKAPFQQHYQELLQMIDNVSKQSPIDKNRLRLMALPVVTALAHKHLAQQQFQEARRWFQACNIHASEASQTLIANSIMRRHSIVCNEGLASIELATGDKAAALNRYRDVMPAAVNMARQDRLSTASARSALDMMNRVFDLDTDMSASDRHALAGDIVVQLEEMRKIGNLTKEMNNRLESMKVFISKNK